MTFIETYVPTNKITDINNHYNSNQISVRAKVDYFFDSDFPLPCFHLTIQPLEKEYCAEALVRNTLIITKILYESGIRFFGEKVKNK